MNFAGIDYWAIFLGGIGGFASGAIWYWAFAGPWMAAAGVTNEMVKRGSSPLLYLRAFVAQIVMAWILAGIIGHLGMGKVTLRNGVVSGALCWIGFVATVMVVRDGFAMRNPRLLLIDGGYWLVALVIMGAVIGGLGVR